MKKLFKSVAIELSFYREGLRLCGVCTYNEISRLTGRELLLDFIEMPYYQRLKWIKSYEEGKNHWTRHAKSVENIYASGR